MRRKALTVDMGIPNCSHWPTLYQEERDLGEVTRCSECENEPEEEGKFPSCLFNDPEDAQADRDFGQADSDYVEYLTNGAPFQHLRYLGQR